MRWIADPHADETVAAILGPWDETRTAERLQRVDALNAVIRTWQTNAGVAGWRGAGADEISAPSSDTERRAAAAAWADADRIARAERMFMDTGRSR
jgi:hypothetical protein